MKALITGASGMIGGLILKHCLESDAVESIVSLVRKPSGIQDQKLVEVTVEDFAKLADLDPCFADIDVAFYCIGVYTGAVPREEFRKITVDYTQRFTDSLMQASPDAKVCFLSGLGADRKEKSRMMFAKDKGAAENYLSAHVRHLHCFRPSYIYPVEKTQGNPTSPIAPCGLFTLL